MEALMSAYIRLDNQHVRSRFGDDARGDIFGGRFPQVIDIRFESQSHAGNDRFALVLFYKLLAGFQYFVRTPVRFVIVCFTGTLDELRLLRIVGYDEPRVYRNAVTAYSAARLKDIHTRMLVGQFDQFPYIDSGFVADHGEFVGKGDL